VAVAVFSGSKQKKFFKKSYHFPPTCEWQLQFLAAVDKKSSLKNLTISPLLSLKREAESRKLFEIPTSRHRYTDQTPM